MTGQRLPRRVVDREHVVAGGCGFFLRHATVEMDRLAESLAISRATLYRVVHSRDELLGEVLWRLAERLLTRARRARDRDGVDGVLEVTRMFTGYLRADEPFRAFLRDEPETAKRVLFNASGGVHVRAVRAQKEILTEADRDCSWPACVLDQLAFLYVRIVESALYAELLGSRSLDPEVVERAARAVLAHPR